MNWLRKFFFTMDHIRAQRNHLAEAYVLGDLPVSAMRNFEAHYFECEECAKDVRDLQAIKAGVERRMKDWLERHG